MIISLLGGFCPRGFCLGGGFCSVPLHFLLFSSNKNEFILAWFVSSSYSRTKTAFSKWPFRSCSIRPHFSYESYEKIQTKCCCYSTCVTVRQQDIYMPILRPQLNICLIYITLVAMTQTIEGWTLLEVEEA